MNRKARRAGGKGGGGKPQQARPASVSDLLLGRTLAAAAAPLAAPPAIPADPVAAALARLRREEAERQEIDIARTRAEGLRHDLGAWLRYAHLLARAGRRPEALAAYRHCETLDATREDVRHMIAALGGGPAPSRAADTYVANMFDGFADRFDETLVGFLDYKAPEILGGLARRILGDARGLGIADLGCGTGLAAPHFRPFARRLAGVDLSAEMLKRAAARKTYDDLAQAEIGAWLAGHTSAFDVAVAADVFCYFGDLHAVFAAIFAALRPGGHLFFTVESTAAMAPELRPSGRYAHPRAYLEAALKLAGLETEAIEAVVLRQEYGKPVDGFAVAAVKVRAAGP